MLNRVLVLNNLIKIFSNDNNIILLAPGIEIYEFIIDNQNSKVLFQSVKNTETDDYLMEIKKEMKKREGNLERNWGLLINDTNSYFIDPIQNKISKYKNDSLNLQNFFNNFSFSDTFSTSIRDFIEHKEIINKFYNEYLKKFKLLMHSVKGIKNEKERLLFTQRLLNRFIFLYFLQKRKILNHDEYFLLNNYKINVKDAQDFNYYSEFLSDLFDVINGAKVIPRLKEIPFLNGSLFRITSIEAKNTIKIENGIILSILEFLEQWNWYSSEINDESDELGISPEILGHIFEKTINASSENDTNQKSKGAWYTPSYITEFICEQSLLGYFKENYFDNKNLNSISDFFTEENINTTLNIFTNPKVINTIKILDPAAGSGAFLVSMFKLLFKVIKECYEFKNEKVDTYQLKKEILVNNLFGVDIEEGAVEISLLRLWLALIENEDKLEALPNIDFNVFSGNSLIGYVDENDNKLIEVIKDEINWNSFEKMMKDRNQLLLEYRKGDSTRKAELLTIDMELNEKLNNLFLKDYFELKNFKTNMFNWVVNFSDIMSNGGFDIVLGNPPYIQNNLISQPEVNFFRKRFPVITEGYFDIYFLFFSQSLRLTKDKGIITLITSDQFLHRPQGDNLKNLLAKYSIEFIIDFYRAKVFLGATTYTSIVKIVKKDYSVENFPYIRILIDKRMDIGLLDSIRFNLGKEKIYENYEIKSISYDNLVFTSLSDSLLIESISKLPKKLSDYCLINQGLQTGVDPFFIGKIENEDENLKFIPNGIEKIIEFDQKYYSDIVLEKDLLKPILFGEDVRKWVYPEAKNFLLFPHKKINKKNKYEVLSKTSIEENYPLIWEYFNKEKIKKALLNRTYAKGVKYDQRPDDWYRIHRTRTPKLYSNNSLVGACMVNENNFTINRDGNFFVGGNAGVVGINFQKLSQPLGINLTQLTQNDLLYLILGILNSEIYTKYFKAMCPPKQKGYYTFSNTFLSNLPVPYLENIKPEKIQKILELTKNLYSQYDQTREIELNELIESIII